MDGIVNSWNENGILKVTQLVKLFDVYNPLYYQHGLMLLKASLMQEIMQHKLVFIETRDVVETTLALDNYRKVCDCGRGAIFFSVAR
jgi:DNA excision repair protein ERCC-2